MDSVGNPLKSDISDESEDECVQEPSRNKNICILEIDDVEDLEIINLILEPSPPEGYHVVNTETLPGLSGDLEIARNLQMFTQVIFIIFEIRLKTHTNSCFLLKFCFSIHIEIGLESQISSQSKSWLVSKTLSSPTTDNLFQIAFHDPSCNM